MPTDDRLPDWGRYTPCDRCGAQAGAACRYLPPTRVGRPGDPKRFPHPGRFMADVKPRPGRSADLELMDYRLKVWRRRALTGDLVADIAAELGMKRAALDRYVVRARKRGHPDAVYHVASIPWWQTAS